MKMNGLNELGPAVGSSSLLMITCARLVSRRAETSEWFQNIDSPRNWSARQQHRVCAFR